MAIVKLGDKVVNLRLTKKNLKQAKARHEVDLSVIDMSNPQSAKVVMLLTDPMYFIEVFFAFHEDQLKTLGIGEDELDELIDNDNIASVREAFVDSITGFFPFVQTVATAMRANQAGGLSSTLTQAIPSVASMR